MITGTQMTGSSIYYQKQLTTAKDVTPLLVSQTESTLKNSTNDYKVDISGETSKIEQEYSGKKSTLKKEHENKIKQLEVQYNKQQNQIEQEYSMKKRALSLNIYA